MKHSITLTINAGTSGEATGPGTFFAAGSLVKAGEPSMTLEVTSDDKQFIKAMVDQSTANFEAMVDQWRKDYGITGTVVIEQEVSGTSPLSIVLDEGDAGDILDDEVLEDDD